MTRVSENSATNSIQYSVSKTKSKLEDLQIKGSNLKRIQKPSDDPIGNTELLSIRSKKADLDQYNRNANYAKTHLELTENALTDLSEVINRAKEIAIAQSSNIHDPSVRKNVAEEINQMRNQALSIANRRVGNRHLFGGNKTQTKPFEQDGTYHGDNGKTQIEVGRDFFIEANMNGAELFSITNSSPQPMFKIHQGKPQTPTSEETPNRGLASRPDENSNQQLTEQSHHSLFSDLQALRNGLLTDNTALIQNSLDRLDTHLEKVVKLRTQIGSIMNSIETTQTHNERDMIVKEAYKSKVEDADITELYSDLAKQQAVLDATYRSSSQMLNNSLLNFLK